MTVAARIEQILARMTRSAVAAGRDPRDITLLAVCKRQPIDRIRAAYDAGVRDFGENTAQGLRDTAAAFAEEGRVVRWHFVGGLQRNKINTVMPHRPWIHSIDRLALAEAISRRAREAIDVLIQVNLGREAAKGGVDPAEAVALACRVAALPRVHLRGLMAIPPAGDDPRRHFDHLRGLSQQLRATQEGSDATELSMGMSSDYETAIRCGATIVRVGTALFGSRAT